MKLNLPVTQVEHTYGDDVTLVSTTDAQGRITHCNAAFAELSGYAADELLGRAHNIVRHPDTPPELFAEMWATISAGRPWSGVVKNRCRNGDHYWVVANVTPVFEDGRIVAYMSVRHRPAAAQVAAAEALYAELARSREHEREAAPPRPLAPRPMHQRLTLELAAGLLAVVALAVLPRGLAPPAQAALVLAAATGVLLWFQHRVAARVRGVSEAAARLAGCDLAARCDDERARSLGTLRHAIWLANLNMRAVVHDVRHEIRSIAGAADEIAEGSRRLAALAEQQSADVQVTAVAMEQITRSAEAVAETAREVDRAADGARQTARRGGQSVAELLTTVSAIERATRAAAETIELMEDIADQTELLSREASAAAARAGEEGIAYAVVASRIGALAHRSRSSAQQVRQLVSACSEHVAEGSRRAGAAQADVQAAVEAVGCVADRLREIATATDEQARGVAEATRAMARIDEAACSNAALAEQSTGAGQALQARAATLARAVAVFRVGG
ncbi:methyl-accepting chemotaxis protein [Rubrivivax gelatinosus]|uniref:Methyl-accepting chemotaxis sensory transducer with Pas/Pac sensor n=1 Tax=Rubrivivax gelatinosus (strain NBRC 100245 / IL144) TaxID=983917 RepID=I0HTM9_RUBGI|nr:PAS domain-containing methyl-accepting chemotaxis protein [Rubrivivax gelatinosus]BAL96366.1 methyl-accepting chemotaxis sensory transducer with Pas/Pac sensor [Rubrivivax gelatinosus IL144]